MVEMSSGVESVDYETSAFLFVGGYTSLCVEEITQILDLTPVKTSNDPLKRGAQRPAGWKTWFFYTESTKKFKNRSLEEVVGELLLEIGEKKSNFFNLPTDCEKEIVVTIFPEYGNVSVDFSHDFIKTFGELPVPLRVAVYSGSDDESE